MQEVTDGVRTTITATDWIDLVSISIIIPAILTVILGMMMRKAGWIKDGDLKLD